MASNQSSGGSLFTRLRNSRPSPAITFSALGALSVGILAGSLMTGSVSGHEQKVDSSDARPLTMPSPVTLSNGFSAVVKQVGPAVVNINTEMLPKQSSSSKRRGRNMPTPPDGDDQGGDDGNPQDFLRRFFGGGGEPQDQGTRRALGSGFIVDPRGYIITNNHVIDKADHIYVKLSSDPDNADQGRPATVIGTDAETDIAVIKIDSKEPLTTIKLGNSDGTQVGDWVLAIGTPFGQRNTVSAGIISALNRSIDEPSENGVAKGQFQRFIQTDAAINPGNSGGPLVDMTGAVVGMNTAIFTQSAGSEGIGFAMPSKTLISVYNQLIAPTHKVVRGSIGIQFQQQMSSAAARVYGFAQGGVNVGSVIPNGPAAKAGVQPGDVITTIDGQNVKDGDALVSVISAKTPGSTVKLGILRDGKKDTLTVGIADRAKLLDASPASGDDSASPDAPDAGQSKLGITEQPTQAAAQAKLKIHGGITITGVKPGSFAEDIGLGAGLVVTEINRKPITDEAAYRSIVSGLKSGDDVVFVVRDPRNPSNGQNLVGGTLP